MPARNDHCAPNESRKDRCGALLLPDLLPLVSSRDALGGALTARYEILETRRAEPRAPLPAAAELRASQRQELQEKYDERVTVAQQAKRLPKPPVLLHENIFFDDTYAKYVREKCQSQVLKSRMQAEQNTSRYSHDELAVASGHSEELRGEDLRQFQQRWMTVIKLVIFLRMRELAKEHLALLNLRRLLAPKVRAKYAKRRRLEREQVIIAMFRHTMKPVTVAVMQAFPVFSDFSESTLESMTAMWTPACFSGDFIIDERSRDTSDLFILDQGEVEITKRRVPTLDLIAKMMASRKYLATHAMTWNANLRRNTVVQATAPGSGRRGSQFPSAEPSSSLPVEGSSALSAPASTGDAAFAVSDQDKEETPQRTPRSQSNAAHAQAAGAASPPVEQPCRTLAEALRNNCDVVSVVTEPGSLLGQLAILEDEASFVGYRAPAFKRCLLWRLPRRVFCDAVARETRAGAYDKLIQRLRVEQMMVALRPTPQALRNCDINVVFRHWNDASLEDLIRCLTPCSFLPGDVLYDSVVNPNTLVFIARGVASLQVTSSHTQAAVRVVEGMVHAGRRSSIAQALEACRKMTTSPTAKRSGGGAGHTTATKRMSHDKDADEGRQHRAPHPPLTAKQQAAAGTVPHVIPGVQQQQAPPSSHPAPVDPSELVTLVHTQVIGPWQCIGDIPALVNERRTLMATAMSKTDCWVCTREQFSAVIQSNPAMFLDALHNVRELRSRDLGARGTGMLRVFLQQDPLLKGCSERLLDEIALHAKPFWFPPHEFLCGKESTALTNMMVILDGSAYVQRRPGGAFHASDAAFANDPIQPFVSAQLTAGTLLNTAAMLTESSWVHSFTVRCRTVVEGYEISNDAFTRAVDRAFHRREDASRALMSKLRDAAAAAASHPNHVPIILPKPVVL